MVWPPSFFLRPWLENLLLPERKESAFRSETFRGKLNALGFKIEATLTVTSLGLSKSKI